jgi:biopolymer transport protein TolR
MAASNNNSDETISEINIVPLVDIILVVLIIFMVASPITKQKKVNVDLPTSGYSDSNNDSKPFQVTVNESGHIFLHGEMISENDLKNRSIEEAKKNQGIEAILTADKNLSYGMVVKYMDIMKSSGINKLSISTNQAVE